jgi:hypothetical protein
VDDTPVPDAFPPADDDRGAAPDPFDPESLRADPGDEDIPVERVLRVVHVRKPKGDVFFRVHPDPEYTFDGYVIDQPNRDAIGETSFLVTPSLAREIPEETERRRIFTWVNREGVVSLWPAKLPLSSNVGGGNSWLNSALEVAESAKAYWVRMKPDMAARGYVELRATGSLPSPKWPDKSFRELLAIAFKDRLITDYDHEVLRERRGEI